MNKFVAVSVAFGMILLANEPRADEIISEATAMGMLAGAADVCGAGKKLEDFELIAGNILLNKATTQEEQRRAVFEYSLGKLNGAKQQQQFPKISCETFLKAFAEQEIFKATVYADGTVKMADGTVYKSNKGQIDPSK